MPETPEPPSLDRTDTGFSRRSVLGAGALALVLGAGAGWLDRRGNDLRGNDLRGNDTTGSAADSPTTTPSTSTPSTLTIPDPGAIDAGIVLLGRRVIETTGEDDLGALLAQLPAGEGDPLERAATIVRDDFANRRTITVDGWILAASEARAAAIISLLCDDVSC